MNTRLIRILPLLDAVAGIWLIISPLRWGISNVSQIWTTIILGIVVVIVGSLMVYETSVSRLNLFWISWINVILGLGAIVYPFYFSLTGVVLFSYIWTGFLISVAALLHALSGNIGRTSTRT